jgi:hypothetical protein
MFLHFPLKVLFRSQPPLLLADTLLLAAFLSGFEKLLHRGICALGIADYMQKADFIAIEFGADFVEREWAGYLPLPLQKVTILH